MNSDYNNKTNLSLKKAKTLFGKRLRDARKRNEMTQEDLASKLKLTQVVIANWEKGSNSPEPEKAVLLAKILMEDPVEFILLSNLQKTASNPMKKWVPSVRFPQKVDREMYELCPEEWDALSNEDRLILCNLAVVMEPFLKIDSDIPIPPTVGFEILALGPDGARYPQLLSWASCLDNKHKPRIPTYLLDLSLLIIGLHTIECYKKTIIEKRLADAIALERLFFTLNLTSDMLTVNRGEALHEILRWTPIRKKDLIFEIHESCCANDAEIIMELKETWGCGIAFDDSFHSNPFVKQALNDQVELEKADITETRILVKGTPGDLKATIKRIKDRTQNRLKRRGFVLEGINPKSNLQFLRNNWNIRGVPLLVQGWGISPSQPLKEPLIDLEFIGRGHGFTLRP